MPNITCPHKKEPGYVMARRCTAPCGGWVVLYDRKAGGLAALPKKETRGCRWILIHWPSGMWAGIGKKELGRQLVVATAKGEDPQKILPATLEGEAGDKTGGLEVPKPGKSEGTSPSVGSESPPTCAGARVEDVPDALGVQRALNEAFPAERIVSEYEAGLTAMKGFVLRKKDGDDYEESIGLTEDHATRIKYLDSLTKYRIGTPDKREKPKEPRKLSMEELEDKLATSPAARDYFRRKLQEAEAAAKVKPTPKAS